MIISELIAKKLAEGLYHPGDMQNGQAPTTIRLPMFRTVGMAPQVCQQVNQSTLFIAEAIVHLIETEGQCDIVPRAELEQLRKDQK